MPANIRKKKPDVKVAYITLVSVCGDCMCSLHVKS